MRYPAVTLAALALALACGSETEPLVGDHAELQLESAGLLDRVTVSPEEARATALELSNGGTIVEAELEEEGDRLIYSFDVQQDDGGLLEVEVDAMTGEAVAEAADDDDDEDDEHEGEEDDEGNKGGSFV
jgi:uncharacterized membrane protein YkoI